MPTIDYTTHVQIEGEEEKVYHGFHEEFKKAKFLSEKKARALIRRRGLPIRHSPNVTKIGPCPDCPHRTIFKVTDLEVPERQEIPDLDQFDWLVDKSYYL